jgi:hypothetical protein
MPKSPGQLDELCFMFDSINIQEYQKDILKKRYISVVKNFQIRAFYLTYIFYVSKTVITVGSIIVPAFISIQGASYEPQLYWITWFISLLVTVCNGLLTLFKIDKRYYFIHTTLELLTSEGWQYLGLSGRYSPKDAPIAPTHENQFLTFFHMAEKIKMRQVEEEFWKFTDTSGVGNATNQISMNNLQTPVTQQGALALLPSDQRVAIEGWLDDMKTKSTRIGLVPRNQLKSAVVIDGSEGTPRKENTSFYQTTQIPGMSVQEDMPGEATPETTVVQFSQTRKQNP